MHTPTRAKIAMLAACAGLTLAVSACGGSGSPATVGDVRVAGPSVSAAPSTMPTTAGTMSGTPGAPGTTASPPATGSQPAIGTSTKQFVFPVAGKVSYAHVHHDYPATDIMAKCGSQVRAVTSGVILEVTRVDTWKPKVNAGATRGGLSISIKGDDGIRYYGSHLEAINAGLGPGERVVAGEPIGKVGQTGDASACHLHFGISPVCRGVGDWWIRRGVIWPWKYLDSWRTGGSKSPVAAVKAWQSKHGCPSHPLVDP